MNKTLRTPIRAVALSLWAIGLTANPALAQPVMPAAPVVSAPSASSVAASTLPVPSTLDSSTLRRIEQLQREQALAEIEAKLRSTRSQGNAAPGGPTVPSGLSLPGVGAGVPAIPDIRNLPGFGGASGGLPLPGMPGMPGMPSGPTKPEVGNGYGIVAIIGFGGVFTADLFRAGPPEEMTTVKVGDDLGEGWTVSRITAEGVWVSRSRAVVEKAINDEFDVQVQQARKLNLPASAMPRKRTATRDELAGVSEPVKLPLSTSVQTAARRAGSGSGADSTAQGILGRPAVQPSDPLLPKPMTSGASSTAASAAAVVSGSPGALPGTASGSGTGPAGLGAPPALGTIR